MKKQLATILLLGISTFLWAAPNHSPISQAVAQQIQERESRHLASFVQNQLETYYQRTDFSDPNRKTGWFRVADFLAWLKTNEQQLARETMVIVESSGPASFPRPQTLCLQDVVNQPAAQRSASLMRAFWIDLGVHYIADKYHAGSHLTPLSFAVMPDVITAAAGPSFFEINANDEPQVFPVDINIGIHEGTHNLFYLNETMQAKAPKNREAVLSELATFYSHYHYALPIKIADGKTLPSGGVRYFPGSYRAYPDFNYQLEYQQFVMGPLIAHKMTQAQTLSLFDDPLQPDMPVWESVFIFLAAKNNHYLSVDVEANLHQLSVSQPALAETARQFGFTQADIAQWQNAAATFIDLGKRTWPGTNSQENIVLWKRARAQEFIFIGQAQRHNAQDFLKMMFGPYSQDPKITKFYNELLNALPSAVREVQTRQYATVIAGQTLTSAYQQAVAPYKTEWRKALLHALEKAGITRAPVIPQGYL